MNRKIRLQGGGTRRDFMRACSLVVTSAWLGSPHFAFAQAAPVSAGPVSPALIDDLIAAGRILVDKGVIDIRGHVSVRHPRDPERYLMSRAIAPELVTAGDVVEYDLNSNPVDTKGREIFSERFIHGEIYKMRPDVKAIVHAHTSSIISFSSSNVPLRPVHFSAAFAGDPVPAFQNGDSGAGISTAAMGQSLAQALGKGGAVMMRGHGVVVVRFSIPSAVGRAVYLDANAQMLARTLAMGGKPIYIRPREDAATANNPYDREWEAWRRKAMLMK